MKKINMKGFILKLFPIKMLGKLTNRLPKALGKFIRGFVYFSLGSVYLTLLLAIVIGIPNMIYECNTYPDPTRPNVSLYTIKEEEKAKASHILEDMRSNVELEKVQALNALNKLQLEIEEKASKEIAKIEAKTKKELEVINEKATKAKTDSQTQFDEAMKNITAKSEQERIAYETKIAQEKAEADKKAEDERIEAEKKAEQERIEAEAKVQKEKAEAAKKAEEARVEAEKRAEQEKTATIQRAIEHQRQEEQRQEEQRQAQQNREGRRYAEQSHPSSTEDFERTATGEGDVYVAQHGSGVYHGRLNCWSLKHATRISRAEAERRGLRPCRVKGCN